MHRGDAAAATCKFGRDRRASRYPWMYDLDDLGLGALGHVVYYSTIAVPVACVLLGCRAGLVARGARAAKKAS